MESISVETHLRDGNWGDVKRPLIFTRPFSTLMQEQQALRFRRVIIIERVTSTPRDLGFGREIEGAESYDTYRITVRAPSKADMLSIENQIRKILRAVKHQEQLDADYVWFDWGDTNYSQERATFIATFNINANRSGRDNS